MEAEYYQSQDGDWRNNPDGEAVYELSAQRVCGQESSGQENGKIIRVRFQMKRKAFPVTGTGFRFFFFLPAQRSRMDSRGRGLKA